ncbi:MAG TPA: FAD-binding oxidoreductase, partial [Rhizobiales bacterium]|nr:FAD-binding oxidoreductase [Hyphomicrobiales bacterium]
GHDFFHDTPAGFCDGNLVAPRGIMVIAWPGDDDLLAGEIRAGMRRISKDEARARIAPLQTGQLSGIAVDDSACDIDVDLLHRGYLKKFKQAGGRLVLNAGVSAIARKGEGWLVQTAAGDFNAGIIVNAAGGWADEIAVLAGLEALEIQPKRRSAGLVKPPDGWDIAKWPLVFGAGETFYFKPVSGLLMVSPADATPVEPHDVWADDMELARAMEKSGRVLGFEVRRVEHTWAGLRTFAPDGNPVAGFDPRAKGFFWLAGQGGYGIQTAPGLSRMAACLIKDEPVPADIAALGVTAQDVSPVRLLTEQGK